MPRGRLACAGQLVLKATLGHRDRRAKLGMIHQSRAAQLPHLEAGARSAMCTQLIMVVGLGHVTRQGPVILHAVTGSGLAETLAMEGSN